MYAYTSTIHITIDLHPSINDHHSRGFLINTRVIDTLSTLLLDWGWLEAAVVSWAESN